MTASIIATMAMGLTGTGRVARAESGRINLHVAAGISLPAVRSSLLDRHLPGADLQLKVDFSSKRFLAPYLGYALIAHPEGGRDTFINLFTFGMRFRLLDDNTGWVRPLGGVGRRNPWGNLYLDVGIGYAHTAPAAPVDGRAHWLALEIGIGYEFSLIEPLQVGPYVFYRHIVGAKEYPSFVGIGLSFSLQYTPKRALVVPPVGGPAQTALVY